MRAAVAGHVGVIAAKEQRSLFQLRVRAGYELAFSVGETRNKVMKVFLLGIQKIF